MESTYNIKQIYESNNKIYRELLGWCQIWPCHDDPRSEDINIGILSFFFKSYTTIESSEANSFNFTLIARLMGPTWVLSAPGGSHEDPMNLVISGVTPNGDINLGQHRLTAPSHYLNQWWFLISGASDAIWHQRSLSTLVQVKAHHLCGTKPLHATKLTYCQSYPQQETLAKF